MPASRPARTRCRSRDGSARVSFTSVYAEQLRLAQETLDADLDGRAQGRSSAVVR